MIRSQAELDERFAWMRARMAERSAHPPTSTRPLSPARYRRRQEQAALPAHLRMLRVTEVAELLGVSPKTVRRWFEKRAVVVGQVRTTKSRQRRRTLLISQQDLEQWISEQRGRY